MFNEEIIKAFSKTPLGWSPDEETMIAIENDIKGIKDCSRTDAINSLLVEVKNNICNTKAAMNINMIKGRQADLIGNVSEKEQQEIDEEMATLHNQLEYLKQRLWCLNSL